MSPIAVSEFPTYSIACIPADGIGPEVIDAGVEVLQALSDAAGSFQFKFENYDWSSKTFLETGKYIPDGGLESLKKHNAILFGAVGAPGESITTTDSNVANFHDRRTRSHLPLGPSSGHLPAIPAIRQRETDKDSQRHTKPSSQCYHRRS